jgi:energy-coupling factor transporter ATP-binding protein EcfA2
MKIIEVNIEKFKVLKDVEFKPEGRNIILTGENGTGKSSLMQFIKIALGDNKNLPDITEGKGYVIADNNGREYTFTLNYKGGKPVITVKGDDGIVDDKKSVIRQLVGGVEFDIDEFVKMSDSTAGQKKQVEIYKSLFDQETIEFLAQLEKKVEMDYNHRTEINREIKQLNGAIETHKMHRQDLVTKEVDVAELSKSIDTANTNNSNFQRVSDGVNSTLSLIEDLERQLVAAKAKLKEGQDWLKGKKIIDVSELVNQMTEAADINEKFRLSNDYTEKKKQLKICNEHVEDLTVVIEGSRQAIQDTIRDINVIPDLTFDADTLLYKNVPVQIGTMSTGEIEELGYRINMEMNKNIGVLFVRNSNILGQKKLDAIEKMAKDNNWQIFWEEVVRGQEKLEIKIQGV